MDWSQWRTILWLRWRLTRNQWRRFGAFNEAAGVLLALCLAAGVAISCLAGLALGLVILPRSSAMTLLLTWDAIGGVFLFFWLVGLLTEIQRSESIDLSRLMHLPIPLRSVFLFNYLASWVTPSILITLPGTLCLAIGLSIARDVRMLAMIPVIFTYLAVVTAWTYWLRGWLVALMANERHRRTILTASALLIVVISQLPNLYVHLNMGPAGKAKSADQALKSEWSQIAHAALPPLWLGKSAQTLAKKDLLPSMAIVGGGFLLAGIGLFQAYRATQRFYHGGKTAATPPRPERTRPAKRSRLLEWRIPGISEEISAIALGTLRSHLRAPEIKMALFGQIMMNVILAMMFLGPGGTFAAVRTQPMLGTFIVLFSLIGAVQLLFNQFGFDRDGFRALVLAPVSRSNILRGKNLATLPFVTVVGAAVLTGALGLGRIQFPIYLSALLMFVSGFLLFAILGNFLSIISPYRVAYGSLKPTKLPPKATFMMFAGLLLSSVVSAFLFLPAGLELLCTSMGWLPGAPVHFIGSLMLLFAAGLAYTAAIGPLGRMLQRREQGILQTVTAQIE